ncbi:hypothetical protein HanPI659440_Chr11g0438471 [Helianthus annuus]|nr:hypothetical protein HanHA300_Chr11g0422901 [Helianthus annuus]KAJ0687275.1 hypothetical protein HanLR1_Chr11g0424281 [Helianthus annuus]KAJ0691069.1 hypothetical protein HanOQP8_Chr11g0425011 [Helianthus annuus]KAJ0735979.1 hypothetical protein HanPI659440_Chr11g0438471 [Helianthus annuus]
MLCECVFFWFNMYVTSLTRHACLHHLHHPTSSGRQGRHPLLLTNPLRQVETCATYRKRLAQGGESSSRPTHALPINPISAQTESAVIKALRDYNQKLIEQKQILMEQNRLLLKRVATLEGQVGSQGEQIQVLFERTVDLKIEALKGRKVRGLIMGDTRADRERPNSHGERISMLH